MLMRARKVDEAEKEPLADVIPETVKNPLASSGFEKLLELAIGSHGSA